MGVKMKPELRKKLLKMRKKIIDKCQGCSRAQKDDYCDTFIIPEKRWPEGEVSIDNKCQLADHIKVKKKKGMTVTGRNSKGRR